MDKKLEFKPEMIEEIYHLYINGKVRLTKSQRETVSRLWHDDDIRGV